MFGIVLEGFAELPDADFQDVIGDEGVRPYLPDELLLGNDAAVRPAQADQDLHHLGLKMGLFTVALNPVQLWLDEPVSHVVDAGRGCGEGWAKRLRFHGAAPGENTWFLFIETLTICRF